MGETRGQWQGSVSTLAARFRPEVREVISEACNRGLRVAIVSFSAQATLIAKVLAQVLPECAEQVMIQAGSPQSIVLERCEGFLATAKKNKQRHIHAVLDEVRKYHQEEVSLNQVMLIDDDFRNMEDARSDGCLAVWFNPEEPLSFACDLCQARQSINQSNTTSSGHHQFACSGHQNSPNP